MIAAIVLAAGRSERMGRSKPLYPLSGTHFLGRILATLSAAGVTVVRVVLGHEADRVRRQAHLEDATVVLNPDYDRGMLSSVQRGVRALPDCVTGFLLWPVDHPLVGEATVRRLIEALQAASPPVVRPTYAGRGGHPVLFAASLASELLAAPEREGARAVVHAHAADLLEIEVDDVGVVQDLDTPEAVRSALSRIGARKEGER